MPAVRVGDEDGEEIVGDSGVDGLKDYLEELDRYFRVHAEGDLHVDTECATAATADGEEEILILTVAEGCVCAVW